MEEAVIPRAFRKKRVLEKGGDKGEEGKVLEGKSILILLYHLLSFFLDLVETRLYTIGPFFQKAWSFFT